MRILLQRFYTSPYYHRLFEWGRLITITGSAQLIIQAIGLVSGILIIRLLPTQEYALYTLANTALANMIVLADSGIGSGVMSQGGKVWQDRDKLGAVIVTGLDLRRKLGLISLGVASPILFFLLHHHGASWLVSLLITLSIIPSFFAVISNSLLEVAPKLQQRVAPLQKIQVKAAFARIALLGTSLLLFPWTFVACLAAGLPQIWANGKVRTITRAFANPDSAIDLQVKEQIMAMIKRLLPDALYVSLSGQITIWLISIFGSTAAVAQAGALSRLAMALNLFTVLFSALVVPRFARLSDNYKLIFKRYLQIEMLLLLLVVCIVGGTWLFAAQALWVLGPAYADLQKELLLMMLGSGIYIVGQMTFALSVSKGWVINPLISIPICLVSIVVGALIIDVSTLRGVFLHGVFVAVIELIMHFTYGFIKTFSLHTKKETVVV